jgi:HEAT repeat protein
MKQLLRMEFADKDFIENLINELADEHRVDAAYNHLLNMGELVVPFLIAIANDTKQNKNKRLVILNLLGEIGIEQAVPCFLLALKENDTVIRRTSANALGWVKFSEQSISYLLDAFINKDKEIRSQIAFILGKIASKGIKNAEAIKFLINALTDENWQVREKAAQALGKFGDKSSTEPLIKALEDKSEVRDAALTALSMIKDERAVEPLINLYNAKTTEDFLRQNILESLGIIGNPRGFQIVLNALKDVNKEIQASAVRALGWFGDSKAFEPLLEMIDNDEIFVAAYATQSLGQIRDERALEPLLNLLTYSKQPLLQIYAIKGLGELRKTEAVESLIQALKSKSADFRYEAAIALGKIGDERALEILNGLAQKDYAQPNLTQDTVTVAQVATEAIEQIKQRQKN